MQEILENNSASVPHSLGTRRLEILHNSYTVQGILASFLLQEEILISGSKKSMGESRNSGAFKRG